MDRHTQLLLSIEFQTDGTAAGYMKDRKKLPESMINTGVERESCIFRSYFCKPYWTSPANGSPLNAVLCDGTGKVLPLWF